jgi:sugar O-acyltransferase (sialic acid O-acetyltransferase NeuD family)
MHGRQAIGAFRAFHLRCGNRDSSARLKVAADTPGGSMDKRRKLIIVGEGSVAEVACEYFTFDSDYEVVCFSVEPSARTKDNLLGLPVVPFDILEQAFPPNDHDVFVAIGFLKLNRVRTRLCEEAKRKGYRLASYISSKAFVWRNVVMGEHCFVFEDNTIQPFARLGNNVTLWSGNHIGHHSVIEDNCFLSSHVVVSGFVRMGENCFLGVNCTIANNIKIGHDCWLSPGVIIMKDVPSGSFFRAAKSKAEEISAPEFFKVKIDGEPEGHGWDARHPVSMHQS